MSDEGYIRAYAHDCNGGLHGDDTSVPCDYVGGHQSDRQSATDDPREILKAAGVECADVGEYFDDGKHNFMLHGAYGVRYIRESKCDAAILALARLVAKYKWQRDYLSSEDDFAYLDHCWEEHNA